jgi:hypothetical protein
VRAAPVDARRRRGAPRALALSREAAELPAGPQQQRGAGDRSSRGAREESISAERLPRRFIQQASIYALFARPFAPRKPRFPHLPAPRDCRATRPLAMSVPACSGRAASGCWCSPSGCARVPAAAAAAGRRAAAAAAAPAAAAATAPATPAAWWPAVPAAARQRPPRRRRAGAPAGAGLGGGGARLDVNAAIEAALADVAADPALAPLLDDPRLAAAIREVARDPAALQRYAGDRKVGAGARGKGGEGAACRGLAEALGERPARRGRRCGRPGPPGAPAPRPQVMAVLGRLLERDMPAAQAAAFTQMVRAAAGCRGALLRRRRRRRRRA